MMRVGGARTLACVFVSGVCTVAAPQDRATTAPVALTVSATTRALYPGSVALVSVASPRPLVFVEGKALGRPVRFWRSETSESWQGFVGVGLDVVPGAHPVEIVATALDGVPRHGRTSLRIVPKQFATRRLKVEERFANPPAAESERIERDALLLASLFADSWSLPLWRQRFVPPVSGPATSSFGRLTVLNGQPRGRHLGADFVAAVGDPIVAPNNGRVVLASDLYLSGNTVILDHGGGLFSLLAHLSRIDVSAGTIVTTGERLGAAGATGRVTGPHLHWAVRLGEVSVDPASLVSAVSDASAPRTSVGR